MQVQNHLCVNHHTHTQCFCTIRIILTLVIIYPGDLISVRSSVLQHGVQMFRFCFFRNVIRPQFRFACSTQRVVYLKLFLSICMYSFLPPHSLLASFLTYFVHFLFRPSSFMLVVERCNGPMAKILFQGPITNRKSPNFLLRQGQILISGKRLRPVPSQDTSLLKALLFQKFLTRSVVLFLARARKVSDSHTYSTGL